MAVAAKEKKKREAKAVGDVITSVSKENAVRQSFKPSQGIKSRARKSKQATGMYFRWNFIHSFMSMPLAVTYIVGRFNF